MGEGLERLDVLLGRLELRQGERGSLCHVLRISNYGIRVKCVFVPRRRGRLVRRGLRRVSGARLSIALRAPCDPAASPADGAARRGDSLVLDVRHQKARSLGKVASTWCAKIDLSVERAEKRSRPRQCTHDILLPARSGALEAPYPRARWQQDHCTMRTSSVESPLFVPTRTVHQRTLMNRGKKGDQSQRRGTRRRPVRFALSSDTNSASSPSAPDSSE